MWQGGKKMDIEDLKQGLKLKSKIDSLVWKYNNLRYSSGKPDMASSSFQNGTECKLIKLAEIKKQIDTLQQELQVSVKQIIDFIEESALDDRSKVILVRRYGYLETFEDISKHMGFTQRHVYRLHSNALKIVSDMSVSCHLDDT